MLFCSCVSNLDSGSGIQSSGNGIEIDGSGTEGESSKEKKLTGASPSLSLPSPLFFVDRLVFLGRDVFFLESWYLFESV